MRWIFYTLVAVNLLLVVSNLVNRAPKHVQPVAAPVESLAEGSVPRIRLLEEVSYAEETREIPASAIQQAARSCLMAGPFNDKESALQMSARLLAHGVNTEIKAVEKSIGDIYWVFLDRAEDDAAASKLHARLRARGVDNFVITDGPLVGRVALGVFSRVDPAHELREEMLRRGLQPEMKKVPRNQTEFWVAVTASSHYFLEDSRWKSLLTSDFKLQQKENFCLDVASR